MFSHILCYLAGLIAITGGAGIVQIKYRLVGSIDGLSSDPAWDEALSKIQCAGHCFSSQGCERFSVSGQSTCSLHSSSALLGPGTWQIYQSRQSQATTSSTQTSTQAITSAANAVTSPAQNTMASSTTSVQAMVTSPTTTAGMIILPTVPLLSFPPLPSSLPCDLGTPGLPVLVLRRSDGGVGFNRTWAEYVAGFGSQSGEFWAGLECIRAICAPGTRGVRVEMETFAGQTYWAEYTSFHVYSAAVDYMMVVTGYNPSSTAGDSLGFHDNRVFSTYDNAHGYGGCNMAGGWWYAPGCHWARPTGVYKPGGVVNVSGIHWRSLYNSEYSFKTFTMIIH